MKKFFAFAIAAVTMTVGCQKIQDLVNPNASVDDTDLVEIKFSSNIATVETETKSAVESLGGLTVKVFGINETNAGKREFKNIEATVAASGSGFSLDLAGGPYYYNNMTDTYSFYGYYLDDAQGTVGDDGTGEVTITGQEDILLATVTDNGTFCGNLAKSGTHPHLQFAHALSQFQFEAVNVGSSSIKLTKIEISTPVNGNVDTFNSTVTKGDGTGLITAYMGELELVSKALSPDDYTTVENAVVMVMPGAEYEFKFTVTQGENVTRELSKLVDVSTLAGTAYKFQVKFTALEEIVITAGLAEWGAPVDVPLDTDNFTEN